jgi:hypothetical protein
MVPRDPQECIDLQCGHFDGDQCLVGGQDCPDDSAYEPDYQMWLEGGEAKGDKEREDGIYQTKKDRGGRNE